MLNFIQLIMYKRGIHKKCTTEKIIQNISMIKRWVGCKKASTLYFNQNNQFRSIKHWIGSKIASSFTFNHTNEYRCKTYNSHYNSTYPSQSGSNLELSVKSFHTNEQPRQSFKSRNNKVYFSLLYFCSL